MPVRADSQEKAAEQRARVKATIVSIVSDTFSRGNKAVTIEMRDGMNLKGYIRGALEESFTMRDAKTRQDATIAYDDVAKVDKGRPEWAKLLIFVGVAYGAGAILFLMALSGGH